MRVLLDTCVIIDALQNREPFAEDAKAIFLYAANNAFIGCISAKSATDIYYLMHRYTHDNAASREVLTKLFTLFEVLDTSGIDCRKAVLSKVSDYEDAIMIETAVRAEVDCVVTRNTKDYDSAPIEVYSPKEFLQLLSNCQ